MHPHRLILRVTYPAGSTATDSPVTGRLWRARSLLRGDATSTVLGSRRNAHAVLSRGAVPIPGVPTWSAVRWEGAVVYAGSVDVVSRYRLHIQSVVGLAPLHTGIRVAPDESAACLSRLSIYNGFVSRYHQSPPTHMTTRTLTLTCNPAWGHISCR